MSSTDLQTQLNQLGSAGYRPYWISGCGAGASKRFSALWINDGLVEHTCVDSTRTGFDDDVQNYRTGGYRLMSATGYNTAAFPQLSGVVVQAEQPPWESFYDQTLADLNATTTDYSSLGYRPTFVTAYETTSGTRYTSAWEKIPQPKVWTVTGPSAPLLVNYDSAMQQFMQARHIPNGALAVTKNGRLVLARGYTNAPVDWPITQPDSRFRLASLSKTLTAVGVMKLIETGVIGIDQPINTIMDTSAWVDPRINQVTFRHLLQHRGGWNVSVSGEAMYSDFAVSATTGQPLPTTPQMIIDYVATRPLDYDPGSQFYYSIFGYCLLGRLIELATGMNYETWMHDNIFSPIQVYAPRMGNSLITQQHAGEPPYHDPYQRVNRCVMGPGTPEYVSGPYVATNVHSLYSSAGMTASAVDYARFLTAFDDPDHSPLLSRATIDLMWSPPPGTPPNAFWYYAAGWNINPTGSPGQFYASHSGSMVASATFYWREYNGVNWVALFSTNDILGLPSIAQIGQTMDSLVNGTTQWPTNDFFGDFGRGDLDCDGEVTMQDIPEFALGLTDPDAYAQAHPTCPTTRADMNGDGTVNGGDIQLFVNKLLSGA
jgi:CubicO group peptidase (beta-lactamase class C family)